MRLIQVPRYLLAGLGFWLVLGLAQIELREHRIGFGTGVLLACTIAMIKALWPPPLTARPTDP